MLSTAAAAEIATTPRDDQQLINYLHILNGAEQSVLCDKQNLIQMPTKLYINIIRLF